MRKLMGLIFTALMLTTTAASARDGYEGRPSVCAQSSPASVERCQQWISTVLRPDTRTSCCGDGDSFIADDFELGPHGELYAIISVDYPDVTAPESDDGTPSVTVRITRGTKILVPADKQNHAPEDANRSGHGVLFLLPGTKSVLCYFAPPLI